MIFIHFIFLFLFITMCSQILKITLADIILERHLLVFEVRDPKKREKQGSKKSKDLRKARNTEK